MKEKVRLDTANFFKVGFATGGSYLLFALMSVVEAAFYGNVTYKHLAAFSIFNFIFSIVFGLYGTYATSVLIQMSTAKENEEKREIFTAAYVSYFLMFSLFFVILNFFSQKIAFFFSTDKDVAVILTIFIKNLSVYLLLIGFMFPIGTVFRVHKKPAWVLYGVLLYCFTELSMIFILWKVLHKDLFYSVLNAIKIARVTYILFLVSNIFREPINQLKIYKFKFSFDKFKEQWKLAFWQQAEFLVNVIGFSIFIRVIGHYSTVSLAANEIVLEISKFLFNVFLGFAIAVNVLIGEQIREGNKINDAVDFVFSFSSKLGLLSFISVAVLSLFLPSLMAKSIEVEKLAKLALLVYAAFSFFDAKGMMTASILRSLKQVKFVFLVTFFANFLYLIPMVIFVGNKFAGKDLLIKLWFVFGSFLTLMWLVNRYKVKKILEKDE